MSLVQCHQLPFLAAMVVVVVVIKGLNNNIVLVSFVQGREKK